MACVDSMIHCISAMLSVDIYKRTLKKDATDQQVAKAARYITFAVVAIVLELAVLSVIRARTRAKISGDAA
jgi:Na+/proline symporter